MALPSRIATAAVLAAALAACGHARHAAPVRDPIYGPISTVVLPAGHPMAAVTGVPAAAPAEASPAPAAAADADVPAEASAAVAARDEARPPARASAPRPTAPSARAGHGAGRGAMKGLGVVLYATGVLCFGGGPITLILCAAALSELWPAYVAISFGAMVIGAAASATPAGPAAPDAPPLGPESAADPPAPRGAERLAQPGAPAAAWSG